MRSYVRLLRILQIYTALVLTVDTQELNTQPMASGARTPPPVSGFLPVSYHVQNVDYLLLKNVSQEPLGKSRPPTSSQPFVVLRARRPPSVNASYGPLSVERVVPMGLLRPVAWEVRAFILGRRVLSSAPSVRVLFYSARKRDWGRGGGAEAGPTCVTVFAFWETREARGSCWLRGEGGVCLAVLEPEPSWFDPVSVRIGRSRQGQDGEEGNAVELYYRAQPNPQGRCTPEDSRPGGGKDPAGKGEVPGPPLQRIGSVRLCHAPGSGASLSQLRLGKNTVTIQTSSKPLRKTDVATFHVSTLGTPSLQRFTLRATMRKGVSFSTARPSNPLQWDIVLVPAAVGLLDTVSIVCERKPAIAGKRPDNRLLEVLQLDFETDDLSSQSDSQEINWHLELVGGVVDEGTMKIYTTQRDYVGLAPLVTDSELMNTAVLTGKRVSMPVRTVAVERDGSVTDVSQFTECRSTDEDVLKVSDRCDYVYVNGKETRGRVKIQVNFTYSYLSAQLELTVWIPQLPLQIQVSDSELSQIKGWRVPVIAGKRSSWDSEDEEEGRKGRGCTLQYQHALVRVLTHFVAEQSNLALPQPPAYFLGREWQMDVTRLVRYFLKVEDPRVARLHAGRVLSGRGAGVTTVQVLSPLSDSVLAEKTVKVLDDKVTITELGVQLVAGLSLSLQLSPGSNRAIVATATAQEVLNTPKQEAVVGVWIQYSDGSLTPLDFYDSSGYVLAVASLDEGVVSVRKDPLTVVAEGEGQGALLRAELLIGEACQKSGRRSTLAVGNSGLKVKFWPGNRHSADIIGAGSDYGNDERELGTEPRGPTGSVGLLLSRGGPVQKVVTTHSSYTSSVGDPGPFRSSSVGDTGDDLLDHSDVPSQVEVPKQKPTEMESSLVWMFRPLSDLEVGMYALLGVFCLAILVFLLNCTSHLVWLQRRKLPVPGPERPNHRHHWVRLSTDGALLKTSQNKDQRTLEVDSRPGIGKSTALGGETSILPSAAATVDRMGPFQAKPARVEPLHSPTSKRKRVQFSTFSTLDNQHQHHAASEQGTDIY